MARTWAVQGDSVNTSIIHLYSTLPRNGRIHGLSKKYRYKHRFSDRSVLFESAESEDRRPNWSGRKNWSRSSRNRCWLSETILRCVRLQPDRFAITPICSRRDQKRSAKRNLVIPSTTLSVVDIFSKPISLKWRSPEQSDIELGYAWRRCDELDFSTKQQHSDCRCSQ